MPENDRCDDQPQREAVATYMDAAYLFNKGENYMSYRFLGSHPYEDENGKGFIFRVWAPNARMVSVMGDFNDWDGNSCQMFKLGNTGIWEQ